MKWVNEWAGYKTTLEIKNKNYSRRKEKDRLVEKKTKQKHSAREKMVKCYSKKQAWGIFETLSLGKQLTRNTHRKNVFVSCACGKSLLVFFFYSRLFLSVSLSHSLTLWLHFNVNDIVYQIRSPLLLNERSLLISFCYFSSIFFYRRVIILKDGNWRGGEKKK